MNRHRLLLVLGNGVPKPLLFPQFRSEVLNGLKVDEAIGDFVVVIVVVLVQALPELLPPKGHQYRNENVEENEVEDGDGEGPVVKVEREDEADNEALGKGRDEVEEAVLHKGVARCDSPAMSEANREKGWGDG